MKVQKQDWKSYEQLAEKIYRKLTPEAVVTHDDKIYGHDSETDRQIDVSIRSKVAGHDILVIVEARDRNRAPDINAVGAFSTVIKDVKAHKGVMVCRKPPGKNAAVLAKSHGIDMCSAFDINDRDWSDDVVVPVVVTLFKGDLTPSFTFASDSGFTIFLPPKPEPGFVSLDRGKSRITLFAYMIQRVEERGIEKSGAYSFVVQDDELRILLNETDWVPLPHLEVTVSVSTRTLFRHCRAQEYLALRNYSTNELTVAEMKLELPPFNDSKAWRNATDLQIYENVADNVPVVDLQLSSMSRSGQFGLRFLPLADRQNW